MLHQFDLSKYSKHIQDLCKRDEEPPYSPSGPHNDETDYKSLYSLTEEDIPHLVEIAAQLGEAEDSFPGELAFAPANAWEALAQLATPSLLPTVLDTINRIDWYSAESGYRSICKALVRSGLNDVAGLITAFQDTTRHDETREIILDSLIKIQAFQPEYRSVIVQALTGELSKLEIGRRQLYARIVSSLMTLEARESLPLIVEAYKQQLVDPDDFGWFESIQKRLGDEVIADPVVDRFEADMKEIGGILIHFEHVDHQFPMDAVIRARACRDTIIPSLIELIRRATAYARYDVPVRGCLNLFAIHLLAEFQAKEALPFVLESLSLTDDQAYNLYSDSLSETVPAILYQLIGNDVEFYTEKILDPATPEVLQIALVDALPFLVRNNVLGKESYSALLRKGFRAAIDATKEMFAVSTLDLLLDCGDAIDAPLIEEAFTKGVIDNKLIDYEEAMAAVADAGKGFEEDIRRRTKNDCSDIVAATSWWSCFQPAPEPPPKSAISSPSRLRSPSLDDSPSERLQKIGRNDSCPCGSGKKYKKCCLQN